MHGFEVSLFIGRMRSHCGGHETMASARFRGHRHICRGHRADAAYASLDAGVDSGVPALAALKFAKRVTVRRQWFEDLADLVCKPLGLATCV